MVQLHKALLSILVILNVTQALPVDEIEVKTDDKIIHDEAKEIKYEDLRDHDLQESVNAGQSGWALELLSHGGKPQEIWGGQRPKRQHVGPQEPMMDHMVAPSAPIDPQYAQRLSGSAIALANQLAGAQRQQINRVPGYGRKKRQISELETPSGEENEKQSGTEGLAPIVNEAYAQRLSGSAIALANQLAGAQRQQINRVTGYGRKKRQATGIETPSSEENEQLSETEGPAPIVNEAYAQRLSGSAIALANQLAGAQRQRIHRVPGYGRKKRQTFEDEAIMQQIFQVQDQINAIEQLRPNLEQVQGTVKINSWGETGLRSPLQQNV